MARPRKQEATASTAVVTDKPAVGMYISIAPEEIQGVMDRAFGVVLKGAVESLVREQVRFSGHGDMRQMVIGEARRIVQEDAEIRELIRQGVIIWLNNNGLYMVDPLTRRKVRVQVKDEDEDEGEDEGDDEGDDE